MRGGPQFSETTFVVILSVVLVVLLAVIVGATYCVLRSNRALAHRYELLREESIESWKSYLASEHSRMLSETAATVARVNAVARTLMRVNLTEELADAVTKK